MTDEFFNHDAAKWAESVVMKMSDAEAASFVEHVTYDVLMADIAANRRTIDNHVVSIHKRLIEASERLVSKRDLPLTRVIQDVAKAAWDEGGVKRDAQGRFSVVEQRIRVGSGKPLTQRQARRTAGVPKATDEFNRSPVSLSPSERAKYQQQYAQLSRTISTFTDGNLKNVTMVLQDKRTGDRRAVEVEGALGRGWNPKTHDLVAVRAMADNASDATAFNVVGALGGGGRAGAATATAMGGVERGGNKFSEEWSRSESLDSSTNARTYRRVRAGSELLTQVTPAGSKANVAGAFGQFVGQYGPEAEKVVGPTMRRTAYRYRGTERKADSDLLRAAEQGAMRELPMDGSLRAATPERRREILNSRMTPELRSAAATQASISYLRERLPEMGLANLQANSGKIPPSEGVIINSKGEITAQAIGVADDHYLPFNLKNLGALKGGSYVRRRTSGGLTTEDIYTGLVSGARSVTVVSNSGVFTVNFDDTFRGARRYNDKAAEMVGRYGKTLDAVKSGQIERAPISREDRANIRDEVEREMPQQSFRASEIQAEIENRVREFKNSPDLTTAEITDIENRARDAAAGDTNKFRQARSDMLDAALSSKQDRFYKLDGEGYATSMRALREQFPYYISDVSFVNNRQVQNPGQGRPSDTPDGLARDLRLSGGTDRGYVKPRYIRPEGAREGYYDESITGRGKISADRLNYANWPNNPENRGSRSESASASSEAPKPAQNRPASQRASDAAANAKGEAQAEYNDALKRVTEVITGNLGEQLRNSSAQYPQLAAVAAGTSIDDILGNQDRREKLYAEAEGIRSRISGDPNAKTVLDNLNPLMEALNAVSGRLGGDIYDPAVHLGRSSDKPFNFGEDAYQPGARPEQQVGEFRRQEQLARRTRSDNDTDFASLSDDDLKRRASQAGAVARILRDTPQGGDRVSVLTSLAQAAPNLPSELRNAMATRIVQNTPEARRGEAENFAVASEAMQRLRRLKANGYQMPTVEASTATTIKATPKDYSSAITKLRQDAQHTFARSEGIDGAFMAVADDLRQHQQGNIDDEQLKASIDDTLSGVNENAAIGVRNSLKRFGFNV